MNRLPRILAAVAWLGVGCQPDLQSGPSEEMLDPASCEQCHPQHVRQWQGSMHAYAAEDPIFLAMNARGQRETGGALGDFCVRCHAPVAVALGETVDGLNLGELPASRKGVTCYFCHNVQSVDGTHNNPLTLAMDTVMRGELSDAVSNPFHDSAYSPLFDDEVLASGDMCGSCHDIVNNHEVHLERTYNEWLDSFFSTPDEDDPSLKAYFGNTCAGCHMPGTTSPVADFEGVQTRRLRDHKMVGVDVALTDFPNATLGPELVAEQLAAMDTLRNGAVCVGICVNPAPDGGNSVDIWLHNESAGHSWPSGATQDRRAWLQLEVFDGDQTVIRSGVVGPTESIDVLAETDPMLWLFRDYGRNAQGEHESMFWNITEIESNLLPIAELAGLKYDKSTWRERNWHVDGEVDRVAVQVNLRAIPFELVDELASEGLYDPAEIKARIPTFVVPSTELEWTPEAAMPTDLLGMCVMNASCFCAVSMDCNGLCEC